MSGVRAQPGRFARGGADRRVRKPEGPGLGTLLLCTETGSKVAMPPASPVATTAMNGWVIPPLPRARRGSTRTPARRTAARRIPCGIVDDDGHWLCVRRVHRAPTYVCVTEARPPAAGDRRRHPASVCFRARGLSPWPISPLPAATSAAARAETRKRHAAQIGDPRLQPDRRARRCLGVSFVVRGVSWNRPNHELTS